MERVNELTYDLVINDINPPYETVAFRLKQDEDLVVINRKIAAFVVDKRIAELKKQLDDAIELQIEIMSSNG